MAFDNAKAEATPLPPPDISSPSNSFVNLSFINSISETNPPFISQNYPNPKNKNQISFRKQSIHDFYLLLVSDHDYEQKFLSEKPNGFY